MLWLLKSADPNQTRRLRRGGWSGTTLFVYVRRSLFEWRWSIMQRAWIRMRRRVTRRPIRIQAVWHSYNMATLKQFEKKLKQARNLADGNSFSGQWVKLYSSMRNTVAKKVFDVWCHHLLSFIGHSWVIIDLKVPLSWLWHEKRCVYLHESINRFMVRIHEYVNNDWSIAVKL